MANNRAVAVGGSIGAAFIALALAIVTPTIEQWEGTKTDPYRDVAGIWTVCTGETRVEMRRYTPSECKVMLERTLEADWAPAVLKAVPALHDRPYQFAAAISLTYNIGPVAFAGSTAARRFNAGEWKAGCDAFLGWNGIMVSRPNPSQKCRKLSNGKYFCEVQGLVNRREAERKLCLTNL